MRSALSAKRQRYSGILRGEGRVDIITGTLGKALGGASGGYTSGRKEIIDLLRQRSRPYLFSNSLAPAIAGAAIELFDMLEESTAQGPSGRDHAYYRKQLVENGFDMIPGTHPVCRSCCMTRKRQRNLPAEWWKRESMSWRSPIRSFRKEKPVSAPRSVRAIPKKISTSRKEIKENR